MSSINFYWTYLSALNVNNSLRFDSLDYPSFYFPDWSTDGKYIVFDKPFRKQVDFDNGGLFYMTAEFKKPGIIFGIQIISGRDPELSPDGTHFIYFDWLNNKGPSEIFVTDMTGSNRVQLTNDNRDDRGPTWSPEGTQIAWSSNIQVHTMRADGSNQQFLAYGNYPSWSVNNEIVFSHANADYSKEVLYIINPDGSGKKQITF